MIAHIHIQRKGDDQIILDYIKSFKTYDDAKLIEAFEAQKKCGITGVHQQALYLIALRTVMMERFNDSPITIEDNL